MARLGTRKTAIAVPAAIAALALALVAAAAARTEAPRAKAGQETTIILGSKNFT